MSERLCEEEFAWHPTQPHLVALCTRPPGHPGNHDNALPPLPSHGVVKGRGRCLVIGYSGNGYFELLTARDERLHIHRDRIQFTNKGAA